MLELGIFGGFYFKGDTSVYAGEWFKYAKISTEVEIGKIDGHQKRIGAKVVRFPFYDPEKTKVKS